MRSPVPLLPALTSLVFAAAASHGVPAGGGCASASADTAECLPAAWPEDAVEDAALLQASQARARLASGQPWGRQGWQWPRRGGGGSDESSETQEPVDPALEPTPAPPAPQPAQPTNEPTAAPTPAPATPEPGSSTTSPEATPAPVPVPTTLPATTPAPAPEPTTTPELGSPTTSPEATPAPVPVPTTLPATTPAPAPEPTTTSEPGSPTTSPEATPAPVPVPTTLPATTPAPAPEPTTTPGPEQHPPDGSRLHCRTKVNGTWLPQRRVRREINLWSDAEFELFSKAANILYHRGVQDPQSNESWAYFARLHPMCHVIDGPTFLPWHRRYLYDLETALQKAVQDCSVTVPFWNSNAEAGDPWNSVVFAANRFGMRPKCNNADPAAPCEGEIEMPEAARCTSPWDPRGGRVDQIVGGWCVTEGVAANWTMDEAMSCEYYQSLTGSQDCDWEALKDYTCLSCVKRYPVVNNLMNMATVIERLEEIQDLEEVSDEIEFGPHIPPHVTIIGGTMQSVTFTAWEPMFFVHHAYVDQLFAWWQEYQYLKNGVDTSVCRDCGDKTLVYYDEPLEEWLGRYDAELGCVLVPKSDPWACFVYQEFEEDKGTVLEQRAGAAQVNLGPPMQGRRSRQQACKEQAMDLELGMCAAGTIKAQLINTCSPRSLNASVHAVEVWVNSTPPSIMDPKVKKERIELGAVINEHVIEQENAAPYQPPSCPEEARLCFACTITCDDKPIDLMGKGL